MILQSVKLLFGVNGSSVGYISCKKGVFQGDPLSLLLFCLAEDVLSRGISYLVENHYLLPMAGVQGCIFSSHAFDAYDINGVLYENHSESKKH